MDETKLHFKRNKKTLARRKMRQRLACTRVPKKLHLRRAWKHQRKLEAKQGAGTAAEALIKRKVLIAQQAQREVAKAQTAQMTQKARGAGLLSGLRAGVKRMFRKESI